MSILQFIASKNYITLNKDLIKILGLEESIILGELASEYNYYLENNELEGGYFYSTIENIESNTTLKEHKQRKAINSLKEKNILDVKIKGIPAKRYIKINEDEVLKILNNKFLKILGTRTEKIEELEPKKLKGNNNIINKNKNNNKYNIYGDYKRIKLTDNEYNKLTEDFGKDYIDNQIKLLDEYVESNNNKNKYTNFNLVIRKSIRDNWFKQKEVKATPKWFNETLNDNDITLEEENELENILKEIGE